MELPKWITELPGINRFVCDPDIFYPAILAELEVETPDQYWLAIAQGCMKFDFDLAIRLAGKVAPGRSITRMVRADDGRKQRWNFTMHPPGKILRIDGIPVQKGAKHFDDLPINLRSAHIRHHYRRIRGFVPAG